MIEKLLKDLIKIPSISKKEKEIAGFVCDYLKYHELKPKISGNNIYCQIGKGKKSLLLNSHLDTVPPTGNWTLDPFKAKKLNGRIYGLGACDAKASLAAMIDAAISLNNLKEELDGNIIFAATCEEEDGNDGFEKLIKKINYDAVVIGEPTNLDNCIAEKGIVRLKIVATGKSAHAALGGINAIHNAVNDIKKLSNIKFKKIHGLLGFPSIQTTIINGGIKKNMIPDNCEFILDIRSTPTYTNSYLLDLIRKKTTSKIEIISNRILPKETDINEEIIQAAKKANQKAKISGFFATSDLAFANKPGIILGPGNPKQAHTENEFVEISQLKKASFIYQRIAKKFLSFN